MHLVYGNMRSRGNLYTEVSVIRTQVAWRFYCTADAEVMDSYIIPPVPDIALAGEPGLKKRLVIYSPAPNSSTLDAKTIGVV